MHSCNPSYWEAEAGETLELRRWRLQWATPDYHRRLYHCTPDWATEWDCLQKKEKYITNSISKEVNVFNKMVKTFSWCLMKKFWGLLRYKCRLGMVAHAYNPSTLEGRGGWITRPRDRDHPGQWGETLSLLKIQKLAGHGGVRL